MDINIIYTSDISIDDKVIRQHILGGMMLYGKSIHTVNNIHELILNYIAWERASSDHNIIGIIWQPIDPTIIKDSIKEITITNIDQPFIIHLRNVGYVTNKALLTILLANFYPLTTTLNNYINRMTIFHHTQKYTVDILCHITKIPCLPDILIDKYLRDNKKSISKNLNFYTRGNNFGDYLNIYLFKKLTGIRPTITSKDCHYLFIGSILNHGNENSIICGAGLIANHRFQKPLFITNVRGPLTRKKCLDFGYHCPENYGDPALLIKLVYNPTIKKKYKLGIVPHHIDYNNVKDLKNLSCLVVNLTINPALVEESIEKVVSQILSCEYIISSSLHGLIMAHTYGIPCMWIKAVKKLVGNDVKFKDHYAALGIDNIKYVKLDNITRIDNKRLQIIIDMIKEYPQPKDSIDLNKILSFIPWYNNYKYLKENKII